MLLPESVHVPVPDLVIVVMFLTPLIVKVWFTVPDPLVFALKVRVFPESPPEATLMAVTVVPAAMPVPEMLAPTETPSLEPTVMVLAPALNADARPVVPVAPLSAITALISPVPLVDPDKVIALLAVFTDISMVPVNFSKPVPD